MQNEEIFEKARELGELIRSSETKKRSDETSRALLADDEAKGLIDNYNRIREEKMAEYSDKTPTKEEAQEVNDYLQRAFEKLTVNPIIKDYLEAARDYEMLLGRMDGILKHFIVGEQEGCSGSCATCGGCH